jgi:hypothetical protein
VTLLHEVRQLNNVEGNILMSFGHIKRMESHRIHTGIQNESEKTIAKIL